MRLKPLLACAASVLAASATFTAAGTASAAGGTTEPANVSDFLAGQLTTLTGRTTVLVHGTSITAAREAVSAAGMAKKGEYRSIGVVIANATKSQIQAVRSAPGVTYVEGGAQPIEFFQETSNTATRGAEAAAMLVPCTSTVVLPVRSVSWPARKSETLA